MLIDLHNYDIAIRNSTCGVAQLQETDDLNHYIQNLSFTEQSPQL